MSKKNKEFIRDHRCERTDMSYKCKIFEIVSVTLPGRLYTWVYSIQSY